LLLPATPHSFQSSHRRDCQPPAIAAFAGRGGSGGRADFGKEVICNGHCRILVAMKKIASELCERTADGVRKSVRY
jgi:hypothetical protein